MSWVHWLSDSQSSTVHISDAFEKQLKDDTTSLLMLKDANKSLEVSSCAFIIMVVVKSVLRD